MLFLQLPLLVVLLPGGNNKDVAFHEHISFQINYVSSFYNHSWTENWGSGWLGELQTHGWESKTGHIIFRWPWSKSNFSNQEMMELERLLHGSHFDLLHIFHNHAKQWKMEYPFVVQMAGGCELHSGEDRVAFLQFAYQGSDLMSFQNNSWLPSPNGGTRAQQVCGLYNQLHVFKNRIHWHFSKTCPRFLLGLRNAGKAALQRQVKPEAWLSTGPNFGHGHQMLVCHISGFHPKQIWAMWMQGEQVLQGTQQSDILPNADGTWYLQIFLDLEAIETSGLYCRVKHSSLEGHDIILYLAKEHHNSIGLIILAVMVPLVLLTGLACWLRKFWTHRELPHTLFPLE